MKKHVTVFQTLFTLAECAAMPIVMYCMFKKAIEGDWVTFAALSYMGYILVFGIASYVAYYYKGDYLTLEDDLL